MVRHWFTLVLASSTLCLPAVSKAESFLDRFRDDDGWFDLSDWVLDNATGFMPVPVAITEPAVGAGLGAAALFFHAPSDYEAGDYSGPAADQSDFVMPNITAIAAGVTENDTWFIGGGHIARWRDDSVRYEGMLGYASLNLTFYGLDDNALFDAGQKFTADVLFLSQPVSFRIGGTSFFVGAEWDYLGVETQFDLDTGIPEIDEITLDTQLSGLRVFVTYDALDNGFTPNSGIEAEVGLMRRDAAIGSDFEFNEFDARFHVFRRLGRRLVVGLRGDASMVTGDVPFFSVPHIDLRGIPALRYQGDMVLLGEAELRWSLHPRISVVGFAGAGRAAESWDDVGTAASRVTRGAGLRYFAARKLGMHVGFDIAEGPEDTHYYLTFGQAWQ